MSLLTLVAAVLLLALTNGERSMDAPTILETEGVPVFPESRTKYDSNLNTGGHQSNPYASVRTLMGTSDQGHPFQRGGKDNSAQTNPQFWMPEAVAMHPAGSVLAVAGKHPSLDEYSLISVSKTRGTTKFERSA